jgi:hypothetical protein
MHEPLRKTRIDILFHVPFAHVAFRNHHSLR